MRVEVKGVPTAAPVPSQTLSPLIDNPFAPEVFATGLAGFANLNGVIVMTLESARCDHTSQPPSLERVVVGRGALTGAAVQALVAGLNQFSSSRG